MGCIVRLPFKHGLLYAEVELENKGKKVLISDVIVDTGAAHSIFLADYLNDLDIDIEENEELVVTYGYGGYANSSLRKRIEKISIGNIQLRDFKIDFGEIDPDERINGLLGLDFLKGAKVLIDLDELKIVMK
ncbi:retropepsin-like aspartic protease [Acetivibrio cellulolyticus]|uniref:retropepsin-like aspartic protease n=1 Tax=Acetivibrio cellulolyticus TaxID=35830 RepID=UPI0001E2D56D|nr:retropepsin-like aspartic protease [Acetivibrio cellulolyticus]